MRYVSMSVGFVLAALVALGAGGPWDGCRARVEAIHRHAAAERHAALELQGRAGSTAAIT